MDKIGDSLGTINDLRTDEDPEFKKARENREQFKDCSRFIHGLFEGFKKLDLTILNN